MHDVLGIDVRAGEAERLDADLVKLPVASLLRSLVAEHRARVVQALRPAVEQIVLERGAHAGGRAFRAQRQALAVERSTKVYISFSTMSVTSPIERTNSSVCSTIGMRMLR